MCGVGANQIAARAAIDVTDSTFIHPRTRCPLWTIRGFRRTP